MPKSATYLNYRVTGDGYPVVFLHGFLESLTMWDALKLSESMCKIEIDLPGHGQSSGAPEKMSSMKTMAEHVKEVLNHLEVEDYHVVGHSMGGYVALELKALDVRCQKVVLMNSNCWRDDEQKAADRHRVAKVVERNASIFIYDAIPNLFLDPIAHDTHVQQLITEALKMDPTSLGRAAIAMSVRVDHTATVESNSTKVMVVQGAEDNIVPVARMQELVKSAKCHYLELAACGHMSHLEQTDAVNAGILEFLA